MQGSGALLRRDDAAPVGPPWRVRIAERPLHLVQTAAFLKVPITSIPPNLASYSLPMCSKLCILLLSDPPWARWDGALSRFVHATADPVQVLRHLGSFSEVSHLACAHYLQSQCSQTIIY